MTSITSRHSAIAMLICATFLVMGMGPLPLPYYRLLRIVVPGCFLVIAKIAHDRSSRPSLVVCLCMALLFNPILPVADDRNSWTVLDLSALIALIYVWDVLPENPERRSFGLPVMAGIAVLPPVFSWFSMRTGHTRPQRLLAFAWLTIWSAYAILAVYVTGPHELHVGEYILEIGAVNQPASPS